MGSTLVDESLAYEHRIRDAIAGSDIPYEQFKDTMMEYYRQNKKGDLEAIRHYGLRLTGWHSEDEQLYGQAKECLRALKTRYHLGIIANQPLGTRERLRAFSILDELDLVLSSAEEGLSKPDPRFFELALERAGCPAYQAAMVGDRLDNDMAPAKSLGMKTVWVKQGFGRFSVPQNDLEIPDAAVEDLTAAARLFLPECLL